jgi:hypothetical protein
VLLARDGQHALTPRHRVREADRDRLMKIDAALGLALRVPHLPLVQHVSEQISESRRLRAVHADREIKSFEAEGGSFTGLRRSTGRIVAPASIRIAQRLVSFGNLAELRRRHAVAGVDVRMKPPRETLVSSLDVGKRCASLQPEDDVEVHENPNFRLQISDCRLISDFESSNQSEI